MPTGEVYFFLYKFEGMTSQDVHEDIAFNYPKH